MKGCLTSRLSVVQVCTSVLLNTHSATQGVRQPVTAWINTPRAILAGECLLSAFACNKKAGSPFLTQLLRERMGWCGYASTVQNVRRPGSPFFPPFVEPNKYACAGRSAREGQQDPENNLGSGADLTTDDIQASFLLHVLLWLTRWLEIWEYHQDSPSSPFTSHCHFYVIWNDMKVLWYIQTGTNQN